jgi:hypothetical protein
VPARGILFLNMWVITSKKVAEEATIIFNIRLDQHWKTIKINLIAAGLVILFVAWRVVYQPSIRSGRVAEDNVHGMGLMFRLLLIAITVVVKIA